jgi:iron complex transport system permease protein
MGKRTALRSFIPVTLPALTISGLGVAVVLLALFTITVGPYPLSIGQILEALWRSLTGFGEAADAQIDTVLFQVRIPRVTAALLVGAGLAAAGTVYQGLFRNPLVSPDILGVSTGAGLGAAVGILLSLPIIAIQGLAFAGGLVTVALVYGVATAVRGHEPTLLAARLARQHQSGRRPVGYASGAGRPRSPRTAALAHEPDGARR